MGPFDPPVERPHELAPEGKFPAILYMIVDCGSVRDSYDGIEKIKHQVYLCWELVGTAMSDGRPFVQGMFYNITDGQFGPYFAKTSNINKMLRGWTKGDEKACSKPSLLGKLLRDETPCYMTIAHETKEKNGEKKTYANVESIKPYTGKDEVKRVNAPVVYGPVGSDYPEGLPEWLKKRINACLELNGGVPAKAPANTEPSSDEDFPF